MNAASVPLVPYNGMHHTILIVVIIKNLTKILNTVVTSKSSEQIWIRISKILNALITKFLALNFNRRRNLTSIPFLIGFESITPLQPSSRFNDATPGFKFIFRAESQVFVYALHRAILLTQARHDAAPCNILAGQSKSDVITQWRKQWRSFGEASKLNPHPPQGRGSVYAEDYFQNPSGIHAESRFPRLLPQSRTGNRRSCGDTN